MGRQRRQQREADHRFLGCRTVGADRDGAVAFAAPDRLDAELDRGCPRRTGGRQRDRQAAGPEPLGEPAGNRAELHGIERLLGVQAARHREQPLIAFRLAARRIELEALLPAELDRRRGEEQRPAEIAVVEPGFRHRFHGGGFGELVGQRGGAAIARFEEVDGAGDAGIEMVGRKAVDLVDAGAAGGQRRPIVGLADAERRDDADAGDRNDRASEMIGRFDHGNCRLPLDGRHQRGALVPVEPDRRGEHRFRVCRRIPFRRPRRRQDSRRPPGLPTRQARSRRETALP